MEAMDLNHQDKEKIAEEIEALRKQQQEMMQEKNNIEREKNQLQYGKTQLDEAEQVSKIKTQEASILQGAQA
jgi:succinate dehydrogenase/fumarate reductase flavoprotein subunit